MDLTVRSTYCLSTRGFRQFDFTLCSSTWGFWRWDSTLFIRIWVGCSTFCSSKDPFRLSPASCSDVEFLTMWHAFCSNTWWLWQWDSPFTHHKSFLKVWFTFHSSHDSYDSVVHPSLITWRFWQCFSLSTHLMTILIVCFTLHSSHDNLDTHHMTILTVWFTSHSPHNIFDRYNLPFVSHMTTLTVHVTLPSPHDNVDSLIHPSLTTYPFWQPDSPTSSIHPVCLALHPRIPCCDVIMIHISALTAEITVVKYIKDFFIKR